MIVKIPKQEKVWTRSVNCFFTRRDLIQAKVETNANQNEEQVKELSPAELRS
jgi:hypothetical protein